MAAPAPRAGSRHANRVEEATGRFTARLEQTHAESLRFFQGSQRKLAELEEAWPAKRVAYQERLKGEGIEIRTAKTFLGVIDGNP